MWKNPVVVVSNGHIQKNYDIVSKPREEMSSYGRKKTACALPHTQYIFL